MNKESFKDIIQGDARWGWVSLGEMFVFLGILILGLAYVWVKGDLDWIKPAPTLPASGSRIPQSLYDQLNVQQSGFKVKEFSPQNVQAPLPASAATTDLKKPMFKPAFKKPANDA